MRKGRFICMTTQSLAAQNTQQVLVTGRIRLTHDSCQACCLSKQTADLGEEDMHTCHTHGNLLQMTWWWSEAVILCFQHIPDRT